MNQCVHGHGELRTVTKHSVDIEYCPHCGGVWLDKGELEKLIQANTQYYQVDDHMAPNLDFDKPQKHHEHKDHSSHHYSNYHQGHYHKKKKKEGFLGEMFDFDIF